ncbi:hypothetical protein RMR21_015645 [Agrobacterium sp. rho-8.1]|nr:hypothetical protein [Agrobacterium sp. rho-8.1]
MNQEIIARGQNAKRVLDMPEFKSLTEEVQTELFGQFRKTNVNDRSEREEIHRVIYACDLFVARLEKYVSQAETEIAMANQVPDA